VPSPKIVHIHDADAAVAPDRINDLRSRIEKRDRTLPALVKKTPAGRAWTTKEVPEPLVPYRPILAYVLGPLAGLVTPAGRLSREWMFLAIVSAAAWISSIWLTAPLEVLVRKGNLVGWVGAVALVVLLVIGFLAWCRGLVFATPRGGAVPQTGWATRPWLVGSLGAIAPGLGLAIVGRSRRAAAALLNAGLLLLGLLVLTSAGTLWMGTERVPQLRPILEWVFLGAALVTFLGAIVWVVLALEGVRLVPGARSEARRWGRWGDVSAVALLVSVIAFAVLFRPAPLARQMDESGVSLTGSGYRILPGFFFQAAMRLDPSRTVYVLHAAELEEAKGNEAAALALRGELEQRIEPVLAKDRERANATEVTTETAIPLVPLPPGVSPLGQTAPAQIAPSSQSSIRGPRSEPEAVLAPWGSFPSLSGFEMGASASSVAPGAAGQGAPAP